MDDQFTRARRIVDKIYCADFIGADPEYTKSQIRKLLELDIDTETFNRVHNLIDSKGYNDELYIKFMARKLPDDYDISEFPPELLKRMQKVDKQNILVIYWCNLIVVYDFKQNSTVSRFRTSKKLIRGSLNIINRVYPIIAVLLEGVLTLHNLFNGTVIAKIPNSMVKSMCFTTDGEQLCVAMEGSIEIYCTHELKLIRSYSIGTITPVQIVCSPTDQYLAFVDVKIPFSGVYNPNRNSLYIMDLDTCEITTLRTGNIEYIDFVNEEMLFLVNQGNFFKDEFLLRYISRDKKYGLVPSSIDEKIRCIACAVCKKISARQ